MHYYKKTAVPASLTPPSIYLRRLICIFSLGTFLQLGLCPLLYRSQSVWWDATIHFPQTVLRVPFVTNCLNKNVTQVNGCQRSACLPASFLCILYILYI